MLDPPRNCLRRQPDGYGPGYLEVLHESSPDIICLCPINPLARRWKVFLIHSAVDVALALEMICSRTGSAEDERYVAVQFSGRVEDLSGVSFWRAEAQGDAQRGVRQHEKEPEWESR
jgi:hypothetical protein